MNLPTPSSLRVTRWQASISPSPSSNSKVNIQPKYLNIPSARTSFRISSAARDTRHPLATPLNRMDSKREQLAASGQEEGEGVALSEEPLEIEVTREQREREREMRTPSIPEYGTREDEECGGGRARQGWGGKEVILAERANYPRNDLSSISPLRYFSFSLLSPRPEPHGSATRTGDRWCGYHEGTWRHLSLPLPPFLYSLRTTPFHPAVTRICNFFYS